MLTNIMLSVVTPESKHILCDS